MKQSKIFLFLLSTVAFSLPSCLKENNMNIDPSKGAPNIVEFENTGNNVSKTSVSKYPGFYIDLGQVAGGATANFNLNLSYSGVDVAPQDITVKLEIDQAALDLYNEQNGTAYEVPPADVYTIPSQVVIKSGTRIVQDKATIKITNNYDFSKSYALPIKISSASSGVISGNFGKAIFAFGVRNIYDGHYTVKGYVSHPNASFTGPFHDDDCADFSLITTGQSSVDLDPGQPFANNGSLSVFGVYPRFTIDPATNKVSITDAAGSLASMQYFPDYDSHYDPATKTIYVKYGWNGSRVAIDTFTYCGPR